MPITIDFDSDAGLVDILISGHISLAELQEAIGGLYRTPAFTSTMSVLVEVAPRAGAGLTSVDISRLVAMMEQQAELRGAGRSALVAVDNADHGVARVMSHVLQNGPREMQVFRDREAALAWLSA